MRRITKIQLIYILSLAALAALFAVAVFKPFTSGGNYTEVSRQSLLKTQDEWILQFDIFNHEGHDVKYSIIVFVSGQDYREDFTVKDKSKFTYIHHLNQKQIVDGRVSYRIYRENESEPFDQATYYLE